MLARIDRVQITAADAAATAARFVALLDAEIEDRDRLPLLRAHRLSVRLGDSVVEILEPDGAGPIADHLASGRGGPFAAGVAAKDIHRLRRQLAENGIVPTPVGVQQFYVDAGRLGIAGLNVIVSPARERARVGLLNGLYEVTHLTAEPENAAARLTHVFALEPRHFVPIESSQFGYRGLLTLFAPDALHRIETIFPHDPDKTMGRYFRRFGPSLYMCYAETDRLAEIRTRLAAGAPADWTGSTTDPNGLFIHPRALGGLMMGVSRTSFAWSWSGRPDRVTPG
jgi:hypothetical protein